MYILSIDQGTTGTTAVIIESSTFKLVDKINFEFTQYFPKPSWVEHDLNEIWSTIEKSVTTVLEKNSINPNDISCIGITNQRETTCALDKNGQPLAKAIVWQDRRTSDFCQELIKENHAEKIKATTGLPIDAYFSATKMKWLQDELKNDEARYCTIDTFILNKLTNNKSFYTEPSNASRTMLFDIHANTWSNELCELFGIKNTQLPEVKNSFDDFGKTEGLSFLPDGIPITGILGDQQAALFGQAGYKNESLKCTYGTGAFMLLNTGTKAQSSKNGLLTTIAYSHNGEVHYALEGSTYIAGAAVQWLRDNLNFFEEAPTIEEFANQVSNLNEMEHILFMPFFTGLGSPYWNSEAKAAIIGLTRDSNKYHLSRACLEGISLSINDLITAFENDSGVKISQLKVDGGAVNNNLLMNLQANFSNLEIIKPKIIETTAYGAALAAALGNNLIKFDQIDSLWEIDKTFSTNNDDSDYYNNKKELWSKMVQGLFS